MPFCGQCGKKLDDDALFCPECGTRVERKASSVSDTQTYSWLKLVTDRGEETATAQGIREAVKAAFEDEDEYAKLAPAVSGRDAVSVLAYSMSGKMNIQIILNERKRKYDACYEMEGFSFDAVCRVFLDYAQSRRLPSDYTDWPQL